MRRTARAILAALVVIGASPAATAADAVAPPSMKWTFDGLFGAFDRAALRRGFQVYTEVCAACHSLRLVHYRNLTEIGFSEDQVKAIAAEVEVADGPDAEGEMFDRPARPSDRFVSPFANDNAARAANNGALPPDLSLVAKSRIGGPDYLYGLMVGYREAPAEMEMSEGMEYNAYFPGHQIAMPAPLSEDQVEYADGTEATVSQMAKDVTNFLVWAAEPELEERKRMGVKIVLFLILLTGMLYAVKRAIWSDVPH
ncbi:MAG: cytochrome c1 [Defluviicoccus sp.]|nr:cytochrome c1 [Defluviicoccus sp.]MDE0383089.1 cytochrome c1 [Defluviicoccus sp.]